jgi:predicted transcriptional regulator
MGSQLVKAITTQKQRKDFVFHLLNDVKAFEYMIQNDLFEKGIQRVGAEQELCIVDKNYRPSLNALKILEKVNDPHLTTELALFNLEINLDPFELATDCFSKLENQLSILVKKVNEKANETEENKILLTGILSTLKKKDLVFENMTPFERYKTLNKVIKDIRGDDFKVHIQGVEELILKHESILFEACNTSFQVHLQVDIDNAIDMYNWSQAIAGPVLSVMSNSPILFGKELWSETRIALFQQSVDLRNKTYLQREQKPRVSFGNRWIKESILELFTDDIARHAPLVTSEFEENSLDSLQNGIMPKLKALNLHNGTLYKWNRLCYGVHKNVAHLRIENRYIPSGPSIKDEIANALFWVGVMQGMPKEYRNIWDKMSFTDAKSNFMNAARTGIDSYFNWFGKGYSAKKLLKEILVPMAQKGLENSNIDEKDIDFYLTIIKQRIENNITGSKWISRNKRKLTKETSKYETNVLLAHHMYNNQQNDIPIFKWANIDLTPTDIAKRFDKLYKVMSTEIFVVNEHDLVELVEKIMEWKEIHHVPVVNKINKVVGLIDKDQLRNLDFTREKNKKLFAKRIMKQDFIALSPETFVKEAEELMLKQNSNCVLITEVDEILGIFTTNDLIKIKKTNL